MRKMDRDIKGLGTILRGCRETSPRMIRANLQFAWDKYVVHRADACCDNGVMGSKHECQKQPG
jgi:hypothetical protein